MATLMLLGVVGCGSDGSSDVTLVTDPPQVDERITGVVSAPNGVLASAPRWWQRPLQLGFASVAQALQGVAPVGAGLPVSLSQLDATDFADGTIDSPLPLITAVLTNNEGRYTMTSAHAEDVASCRKMLAVGGGTTLTRALVFSHEVNLNAASEALVRVLLDHVAGSQAQLCNYTVQELTDLDELVRNATFIASGGSVEEINDEAYRLASTNAAVRDALQNFGE